MCSEDQSMKIWLKEELIPKIKSLLNKSKCTVNYKVSFPDGQHCVSTLFLLDLNFTDVQEKCENTITFVVKRPSTAKHLHDWVNFQALFHNEILFYTKFAKNHNNYPRLIYASENPPYDSVIVVENLNKEGYFLHSQKVNLSNKYFLVAIRELARFHATGYALKQKNPTVFFEIVKDIQNYRYASTDIIATLLSCKVPRIINYLRKHNYEQTFCDKIESFLSDSQSNVILGLSKPIEPLATLCHGDFTIDNILYKESNDSIQVKLIDFAMITYCSPFVDFSVFLLMSGTREHRKEKFPEIFEVYYDTLLQCLKEDGVSNLEIFSKERLLEDYKYHALYGYVITCLFQPVLLGYYGDSKEHLKNQTLKMHATIGGDEVTKILVDMLLDLKEFGCLDHVMNL